MKQLRRKNLKAELNDRSTWPAFHVKKSKQMKLIRLNKTKIKACWQEYRHKTNFVKHEN